ncbi:MAG: serine/threonine-protein kinase, partial [Verrucomicrobia bacterium]|nr:serine/threonine-protein kinase [Verrucomicrobiota bacterium]
MSESSSVTNSCPKCGAALPSEATAGVCPRCLMAEAMAPTHPDAGPAALQKALTPAELAPHFPQLEILESLGRGGMGVVYKARQKSLNRFVALKLLAPERVGDAGFAERFQKEAQALAALNHPHIVTVHDFGQAGGFYYLLMEFVDGVNLRQAMKAGRFTPEQALAVVPPVCEALQYAHNHGIVHRDIKPENLLLDREGRVMIADFGIAKMLGTGASGVGLAESQPAGTPQYMAPEQQTAPQRADNRADIYSLGVVLYEMLTGELPGKPLEPPSHKVRIDVRLDEVVLHALEKEPERRYQQVSEVKTMIETIVTTPGKAAEQRRAARPEGEWSASAPPVDPAAARRYAWEITIVGCGTIILIWCLLFALELPRFKAATLATGLIGLLICILSWAGIWPFPSPLFPEPNFSSRNLRRSMSSVPVAIPPEISAGTGATKVLRPALLTLAWHAGLLLATFGFLVSVVPRFAAMFKDFDVALPALTLLTLNASGALRHGGFLLFPVLLALDAGICILTQYLGGRRLRHVWSALVGCVKTESIPTTLRYKLLQGGQTKSATAAIPTPAFPLVFGPVIEREICFASVADLQDCFLDLDHNQFVTPPPEVRAFFAKEDWIGWFYAVQKPKETSEKMQAWLRASGADLLADGWQRRLFFLGGWSQDQSSNE